MKMKIKVKNTGKQENFKKTTNMYIVYGTLEVYDTIKLVCLQTDVQIVTYIRT